jgi:hypothetical protein
MARPALLRGTFVVLAMAFSAPAAASTVPTFGPLREVATLQPGAALLDLANGDFAGDGRQDVLVVRGRWASPDAQPISVLVNDGNGGFSDRASELFSGTVPTAVWPRQVLIGDYNEDGRADIFIGDSGMDVDPFPGHTNHLLLSAPGGKYVDASTTGLPQDVVYFHSGATGDIDGDHHLDLLLANLNPSSNPTLRLLLGDGHGKFTPVLGRFPAAFEAYPYWFTRSELLDVDGDGDLDAVLLGMNDNPLSAVLLNDGHGTFTQLANALPAKPFGSDSIGIVIQPVELNGDSHIDLLLGYTKASYQGRWIQVVINNGDGTFRDETAARLPQSDNNLDWPYNIDLADLNSDGAPDFGIDMGANFCCATPRRAVPPFYLNRGDGTFEPMPSSAFAQDPYGQFRLIDVNGDGLLDVFGAWEAGAEDAVEHYAVNLQGDTGTPPPTGGGGGDTSPPPPPRAGAALIAARHAKLTRGPKRRWRLDTGVDGVCPAGGPVCTGTVSLKARVRPARPSRMVGLQSGTISVRPGRRAAVLVLLTRRARRMLAHQRQLSVRIDITLTGPNGSPVGLHRVTKLKVPREL